MVESEMPRKIVPLAQVSKCLAKIGIFFVCCAYFLNRITGQIGTRHSCFKISMAIFQGNRKLKSRICFLGATHRIEPYNSACELLPGEGYEVFGWSGSAHYLLGKNNTFFFRKMHSKKQQSKGKH
jgi:hypothetical protein